jgi:carboxypeptidase C (cathepsin A)
MTENGPFRAVNNAQATAGVSLERSAISWNRVANVLYIDAPAGVGYSYSDTAADYSTDNEKTALDNYQFVRLWYKQFPEFVSNPLWITGESYAGDYVPQLVEQIIDGPDAPLRTRLTGFMVGNPVMYVCVCMYIYIYICVCVCMCVCMCIHVNRCIACVLRGFMRLDANCATVWPKIFAH